MSLPCLIGEICRFDAELETGQRPLPTGLTCSLALSEGAVEPQRHPVNVVQQAFGQLPPALMFLILHDLEKVHSAEQVADEELKVVVGQHSCHDRVEREDGDLTVIVEPR